MYILYIDEYTYTSISKYEKPREPHLEAVICQPLGWSHWAKPVPGPERYVRGPAAGSTADALKTCEQMGTGTMDVSRGTARVALCSGCFVLNVGDYRLREQQIYGQQLQLQWMLCFLS